jgi:O-antigen/teichoic acid export membrane protein
MAQTSVLIATLWALLQRFGTMLISFSTNIVLARLLMPEDFGTIGMLLIFIAVANTFVDGGLGAALIQRSSLTQEDKSTVFFSNLVLSVFLYLILFASSPWIANFYSTPLLSDLLRVQGLVLILQAFGVVQTALLSKSLDFKKISMSNLVGNLLGAITGIVLACCGFGVWSLVAKALATTLVTTILLWGLGGWLPTLCFSFLSLKNLYGFG